MKKIVIVIIILLCAGMVHAVDCGDTITADTVLDSDLSCDDDGLMINSGNLDCAGFTISGNIDKSGVLVRGDAISVSNCNIQNFGVGVDIEESDDISISGNEFNNNQISIGAKESTNLDVTDNTFINSNIAILYENVEGLTNQGNTFQNVIEETRETVLSEPESIDEPEPIAEEPEPTPEPVAEPEPIAQPEPIAEEPEQILDTKPTDRELMEEIISIEYNLADVSEEDIEEKLKMVEKTLKNVEITRETEYIGGSTRVRITIIPKSDMEDFKLYEKIPKCFSQYTDAILFGISPTDILQSDPLVMWKFDELKKGKKETIIYSIDKIVPEECLDIFAHAGITQTFKARWIWYLIIIPIVAFVIIYFSRFAPKKSGV